MVQYKDIPRSGISAHFRREGKLMLAAPFIVIVVGLVAAYLLPRL